MLSQNGSQGIVGSCLKTPDASETIYKLVYGTGFMWLRSMVVTATVFLVSWTWTADKKTKDASFCSTESLLEVEVVT